MTEDEQFAERLRTRVDPLTPAIEVDQSNVLARGRRSRTVRHALGLTAAGGRRRCRRNGRGGVRDPGVGRGCGASRVRFRAGTIHSQHVHA